VNYEVFYYTHTLLAIIFLIFTGLHVGIIVLYVLIPGIFFWSVDHLLRLRPRNCRLSAIQTYHGGLSKLTFKLGDETQVLNGQYIYLNVPSISKLQWHPVIFIYSTYTLSLTQKYSSVSYQIRTNLCLVSLLKLRVSMDSHPPWCKSDPGIGLKQK